MAGTTTSTLFVNQGADYSFEISLANDDGTEKDLTGYTARAYFAKSPYSVTKTQIIAEVASPATAGVVTFRFTPEITNAVKGGSYLYDAEIIFADSDETITERILEGVLEIVPSISQ